MANFNSLPKAIRERIYELHLTQEEPISLNKYIHLVGANPVACRWGPRGMPALLKVSREIDKEAAPFFYARNSFEFRALHDLLVFAAISWLRHRHLIRKVTVTWSHGDVAASECFHRIACMRDLEELYIRVDEQGMLLCMLPMSSYHRNFIHIRQPTAQQKLIMLRHHGVVGLLKLRIPKVKFIKLVDGEVTTGGPIPGGALETIVAPKMMEEKSDKEKYQYSLRANAILTLER
ncbi:hypothetical protein KC345_g2450 [Hortaea werneckii]|nr:hypothetical protein KC345_g2450 [Hortaea werneckii]